MLRLSPVISILCPSNIVVIACNPYVDVILCTRKVGVSDPSIKSYSLRIRNVHNLSRLSV